MAVVKRRQSPSVMGKAMTRENRKGGKKGRDMEAKRTESRIRIQWIRGIPSIRSKAKFLENN